MTDRLNEVLEEHGGLGPKTATKKESLIPEGYVDVNEATFDSNPDMFKKNTAKVGIIHKREKL